MPLNGFQIFECTSVDDVLRILNIVWKKKPIHCTKPFNARKFHKKISQKISKGTHNINWLDLGKNKRFSLSVQNWIIFTKDNTFDLSLFIQIKMKTMLKKIAPES